jgi:exosortase
VTHIQWHGMRVNLWAESALWATVLAAAAFLYWPALDYMIGMWHVPVYGGTDYSHGPLLPLVSLYALWSRRANFRAVAKAYSLWGVATILFSLLMHWVGMRSGLLRLSLFSLILFLWGCGLSLYGAAVARMLLFPIGYLVFCVPLNILDGLSFKLRIAASVCSNEILNGLGLASHRAGTAIYSTGAGGFAFDVADPCSGIRSLLALMALAAAYAYFTQHSFWRKWALFLCAVPIAIAANVTRIVSIAMVAQVFGQDAAMRIYHDFSGYIVFGAATLFLLGAGRVISVVWSVRKQVERQT